MRPIVSRTRAFVVSTALMLSMSTLGPGCDATRDAASRTSEKLGTIREGAGDTSIKLQIKAKYADDPDIIMKEIQIEVKDHVVTLNGSQPTFEGRRHAEQAARDVKGVVNVISNLTIDPPKHD